MKYLFFDWLLITLTVRMIDVYEYINNYKYKEYYI